MNDEEQEEEETVGYYRYRIRQRWLERSWERKRGKESILAISSFPLVLSLSHSNMSLRVYNLSLSIYNLSFRFKFNFPVLSLFVLLKIFCDYSLPQHKQSIISMRTQHIITLNISQYPNQLIYHYPIRARLYHQFVRMYITLWRIYTRYMCVYVYYIDKNINPKKLN